MTTTNKTNKGPTDLEVMAKLPRGWGRELLDLRGRPDAELTADEKDLREMYEAELERRCAPVALHDELDG